MTLPVSGRRKKTKKNAATFAPDVTFPIAAADVLLGFSCHGLHKYLLAMPQCHAYAGWLTWVGQGVSLAPDESLKAVMNCFRPLNL